MFFSAGRGGGWGGPSHRADAITPPRRTLRSHPPWKIWCYLICFGATKWKARWHQLPVKQLVCLAPCIGRPDSQLLVPVSEGGGKCSNQIKADACVSWSFQPHLLLYIGSHDSHHMRVLCSLLPSQAVVVDRTMYISGQLGLDTTTASGQLVEGGVQAQAKQVRL